VRLKLDENLGTMGATELRAAGFDVATVVEQGLVSCSDRTVLEVCRLEQRCVLTLDLDFSNPIVYPPRSYAGIVVFRLPNPFQFKHLSHAITTFASAAAGGSLAGRLWIVEMNRVREYGDDDDDRAQ
jgi:predicted nuclease of predicted toxin-antitoxin system